MSNVVFTGKCYLLHRAQIMRPALTRMAGRAGFTVLGTVKSNVRYLVASRMDTRKARAAREMGVEVISYEQFVDMCEVEINRYDGPINESRVHRNLPLNDAGRMASEEELAEKLPKLRRYRPNKIRKTAIGATHGRRALDLG